MAGLVQESRMHARLLIDDEEHTQLLKEVQDSPLDINTIVAKRRKDFTEDFFRHLTLLAETYDGLEEQDTIARLVKEIMYRLYKTTQSSLRSIVPKEIKLLKYLLNIADPEERFSALATAFSLVMNAMSKNKMPYTTPKELHKWVKIMLDAYHLNKEETEIREAKKMNRPVGCGDPETFHIERNHRRRVLGAE